MFFRTFQSLIIILFMTASSNADDCPRPHTQPLLEKQGQMTGSVSLQYSSRVERHTSDNQSFSWCIASATKNQNVLETFWGDSTNPKRFLGGLVVPGDIIHRTQSFSAVATVGRGAINFRRKNRGEWENIEADTISPTALTSLEPFAAKVVLAQAVSPLTDDCRNRLQVILSNSPAFATCLKNNRTIVFSESISVALPRTKAIAAKLLENDYDGSYEDDFALASFTLRAELRDVEVLAVDAPAGLLTTSLELRERITENLIRSNKKEEAARRLDDVLRQRSVFVRLKPQKATAYNLPLHGNWPMDFSVNRLDSFVILLQRIRLEPIVADVVYSIGNSELVLASFTTNIFSIEK